MGAVWKILLHWQGIGYSRGNEYLLTLQALLCESGPVKLLTRQTWLRTSLVQNLKGHCITAILDWFPSYSTDIVVWRQVWGRNRRRRIDRGRPIAIQIRELGSGAGSRRMVHYVKLRDTRVSGVGSIPTLIRVKS